MRKFSRAQRLAIATAIREGYHGDYPREPSLEMEVAVARIARAISRMFSVQNPTAYHAADSEEFMDAATLEAKPE